MGTRQCNLKRSKADEYIEILKEKAREINASDYFFFGIKEIIIFGSYVNSDKEVLGDLDVGVALYKKSWAKKYSKRDLQDIGYERWYKRPFEYKSENDWENWFFAEFCLEEEVYKHLRMRRKSMSVHKVSEDDGDREVCFNDKHMYIVRNKRVLKHNILEEGLHTLPPRELDKVS